MTTPEHERQPGSAAAPAQGPLTVCYDGSCPLCSREIAWYQCRQASQPIDWLDVGRCAAADLPAGMGRERLQARFHVREANGDWVSGAAAFVRLWQSHPGLSWLARLARLPGSAATLEGMYRVFLGLRPSLVRLLFRHKPESGGPPCPG